MRVRLAVLLLALPLASLAAAALAADAEAPVAGRITVVAPPKKTPAAAEVASAAPSAPSLAAPTTTTAAAPAADPGQCRMDCAQAYYFCRPTDVTGECAPKWTQCVAACDLPALAPPVSTAP